MKFVRKELGAGRAVWDCELGNGEFLRIAINLSGQYTLFKCYGLAENGITPLRSNELARGAKLNECKAKAQELFEPKVKKKAPRMWKDYSHIRMPYKD